MGTTQSIDDGADENGVQPRQFSDEYTLEEEIGKGTFAKVYHCVRKRDGQRAAVKVVSQRLLITNYMRKKLREETRILAGLHHPHITKLYDVFRSDEEVYIVQELCEGGTLLARLKEKERYPEAEAKEVVKRLIESVAYAHSEGIVHRDLKPENVLLKSNDSDVDIRLADWGVSRETESGELMTTVCGTPPFMAPEVIEKGLEDSSRLGYDERMDVWSIGVITYMLLAGYNPFESPYMHVLVSRVLKANVTFPPAYFGDVSEEAIDFIRMLLEKDPEVRPLAAQCLEHKWFSIVDNVPSRKISMDDAASATTDDADHHTKDVIKLSDRLRVLTTDGSGSSSDGTSSMPTVSSATDSDTDRTVVHLVAPGKQPPYVRLREMGIDAAALDDKAPPEGIHNQ